MKAVVVSRYGGPDVAEIKEVPAPSPGVGEVAVQVRATTVTAGDWRVRSGDLPRGFGWLRGLALGFGGPRRRVLGTEAAGVVAAVGPGVTRWAVGDEVVCFPGGAMGGHAEVFVVPQGGRVVAKPANLPWEQAAALPFGGVTALDFLRRGRLVAGERLLVNGASGNVGVFMVQLGKRAGAHVTAVCSGANATLARELGADEVLDYQAVDPLASGKWDVIADCVGNMPYSRAGAALAPGGRLLAVLAELPAILGAPFVGGGHKVIAGPSSEQVADLQEIVELAGRGEVRAVIDEALSFDDIVAAYQRVDSGRKRGSVVLRMGGAG